jgi:hypothetical protein
MTEAVGSRQAQPPAPMSAAFACVALVGFSAAAAALMWIEVSGPTMLIWLADAVGLCAMLIFVLALIGCWKERKLRGGNIVMLICVLLLAVPLVPGHLQWREEHAAFHELVQAMRPVKSNGGQCPDLMRDGRLAPIALRIRGLKVAGGQVIWRMYSSRRDEVYDCNTGRISLQ